MPDYQEGREESYYQNIVSHDQNSSEETKRTDCHDVRKTSGKKGRGSSEGSDKHCFRSTTIAQSHSFIQRSFGYWELSSLAPRIIEDKEIISCNSQNYKYSEHMDGGVVEDSEDEVVEEESQRKGQERLNHAKSRKDD